MGAFSALKKLSKEPLQKIAETLKYDISNIYILTGDENALQTNCPDIYDNLVSCVHNRDSRTKMEYAQDLVASWIFEDIRTNGFKKAGLDISLSGTDCERILLKHSKISSGSDTKINIQGKQIYMEIMCDYTSFWERTQKADLRDSKYLRLKKEKAIFLGFDVENNKYVIIDFSKDVKAEYIAQHKPYGNKPAYRIDLSEYKLHNFSYDEVIEKIKEIADRR